MAYEKGKSKTGGRKKGGLNKTTIAQKEAYESIMLLLEQRMLNGDDVVNNLSVGRVADLYVAMLNYSKPKLSSTKVMADVDNLGEVKYNISIDWVKGLNPNDEG